MAKSVRKPRKNVLSMPKAALTAQAQSLPTPTRAAIAARAFALYCERGGQHGRDVEDWLRAERELQQAVSSTAA
jgi:DUF2934 family protein